MEYSGAGKDITMEDTVAPMWWLFYFFLIEILGQVVKLSIVWGWSIGVSTQYSKTSQIASVVVYQNHH